MSQLNQDFHPTPQRYIFHEVRVPLNSISMGLQLLFLNVLNPETAETVDMMVPRNDTIYPKI